MFCAPLIRASHVGFGYVSNFETLVVVAGKREIFIDVL